MFVDELDKYFADVGLYILTVGWIMFLFLWHFGGLRCVNESGAEYPLFLSAVSYSVYEVQDLDIFYYYLGFFICFSRQVFSYLFDLMPLLANSLEKSLIRCEKPFNIATLSSNPFDVPKFSHVLH